MQSMISRWMSAGCLLVVVASISSVGYAGSGHADAAEKNKTDTKDKKDETTAEANNKSDEKTDDGPAFLSAPPGYTWSLEAGYRSRSWRTAAAAYEPQANLQLGALYRLSDIWSASARLDWSRRQVNSGPLTSATQQWRLLGGFGVTHWFDSARMELQAEAGVLLKTARHTSTSTEPVGAALVRPTFGGSAAIGLGFFERFALSIVGGAHWSTPGRFSPLWGIRFHTAFGLTD